MSFDEIKERFITGNNHFFYLLDNKESLFAKGTSKGEVKEKIKEKVTSKPDKYKNKRCLLLYITFREPDNRYVFGEMMINIILYNIDDNLKLEAKDKNKIKYVVITKRFIEKKGWDNIYLQNIAKAINLNLLQFNILAMPDYLNVVAELQNYSRKKNENDIIETFKKNDKEIPKLFLEDDDDNQEEYD